MKRRNFIRQAGAGIILLGSGNSFIADRLRYKAVLFDGLAIFNTGPVVTLANELFSGNITDFISVWRSKQFEYCWLRETAGQYADFWQVTREALHFAASKTGIPLDADKEQKLMNVFLQLPVWEDVKPGLELLKRKAVRLGILSNFTKTMLDSCIAHAGFEGLFSDVISTDEAKSYKPSAKSYQLGLHHTWLSKDEVLFVAFAGWDVAGAKWFGYPAYWLNRGRAIREGIGEKENRAGTSMSDLLQLF
jgi:2-haloacid dehalogenase